LKIKVFAALIRKLGSKVWRDKEAAPAVLPQLILGSGERDGPVHSFDLSKKPKALAISLNADRRVNARASLCTCRLAGIDRGLEPSGSR
jgi:hypothetical protein